MDLETKQTKLTLSQTKRKILTLEARHSISIEASNRIRSKLSPRLFIPKLKYKTQYFSKELKPKNENLKKFTDFSQEHKTLKKCQIENLTKCLKGKYTKKLQFAKSLNKMENNKINLFQNKYQNIKILRKNMQRIPKDLKHSVAVDKQNMEKAAKSKCEQNNVTPSNTQSVTSAKDNALKNWGNLKVIANENSTDSASYLTDGEIIFIDDSEELHSLYKDESTSDVQNLEANGAAIFKKPALKSSMENIHKNNGSSTNLQVNENDTEATASKKKCNSLTSEAKNSKNKVEDLKVTENCQKIGTKSVSVIVKRKSPNILQNSLKSPRQNEDCTKIIENEKIKINSAEISREEAMNLTQTNIKQTKEEKEKEQKQPILNIQKYVESFDCPANKEETLSVSNSTKSSKSNNITTKDSLKYNNVYVKSPLDNYLHAVKSAVEDFQDAVRSSISLIYDCSPNDRKINGDLKEMENYVEDFSKYVLQSYHDVEAKELETKNFMEHLRRLGVDHREYFEPNRSPHTTSLDQTQNTEETTDTLTILIEAEKMPTKSITFKTRDIFCQKINQYQYIDGSSAIPRASLQSYPDNATNSIPAHTQNEVVSTQTLKNYKRFSRRRRKITPKILKHSNDSPALNGQYQTPSSAVRGQDSQLKNTILCTNPFNVIYTQAPNNYNSFPAPKPLNLSANKRSISSVSSPVLAESPAAVTTDCYNYSPAVDVNNGNLKLRLSEDQRQYFCQPTNETQNYNTNRFEPQNIPCRASYLQNHYIQQLNELNAYNSQSVNNFNSWTVTNSSTVEDLRMGNN